MGVRQSRIFAVVLLVVAALCVSLLGSGAIGSGSGTGSSVERVHAAKKKCAMKKRRKCRNKRVMPATQASQLRPTPLKPSVYSVPKSIKSDCSVAVEDKIMAWLATVPDGSTVMFGKGRCYGQDGTITLTGRNGLVIDGQGSEFRALTLGGSHRANWQFIRGSNLVVRNMAIRGSNANGVYDHDVEWQHGYSIEGVQGMNLSNVQARETFGDGIYLWRGASSPACGDDASSARNVTIANATRERIGRQGVAAVDAENVKLEDSTIGPVAWANVDLETDDDCEIARHVIVQRNSFGTNGWGVIVNGGFGGDPQVGDLKVLGNVQTGPTVDTGILPPFDPCRAPVRILASGSLSSTGYTFSGNQFLEPNNALVFRQIRNIDVSSNSVTFAQPPPSGCNSRAGVRLTDSHTVAITGNAFSGATSVFIKDPLSDGITEAGNTTG